MSWTKRSPARRRTRRGRRGSRTPTEAADVRINPRFGELDVSSGQILDAGVEDVPGAEAPQEEEPAVGESPSLAP